MSETASIQQLTNRLDRIEAEVTALRQDLSKFLHQQENELPLADAALLQTWVNKDALSKQVQNLFQTLSIEGKPIGAELLQKQMDEAGLAPNELSHSLIEARES